MNILNTYDDFNFMLIILFLFIFLFAFMLLIINNTKTRRLNKQYNNLESNINNSNNSNPTLQCIPRPTLIGNTIQMSCS
jgi:hypothetical protein